MNTPERPEDRATVAKWKKRAATRFAAMLGVTLPRAPMTTRERTIVLAACVVSVPTSAYLIYQAFLAIR